MAAGWYIAKGDGSPEFGPVNRELWDWPRLLELLADPERRVAFEAVVAKHDLRIGDYIGGGFTPKGAVMGFRARLEDGELVLRSVDGGRRIAKGWDALLDRLARLDRTQWHDLHVWREWPAEDAIAMGQPFATRELVPVLVDLARVYVDAVWPGGSGPAASSRVSPRKPPLVWSTPARHRHRPGHVRPFRPPFAQQACHPRGAPRAHPNLPDPPCIRRSGQRAAVGPR